MLIIATMGTMNSAMTHNPPGASSP